jgi:hypothetical protein
MARGVVSKSEPAYIRLRTTLNGLLALAEDLTGFEVVCVGLFARRLSAEIIRRNDNQLEKVSGKVARTRLQNIDCRVSTAIHLHVVAMLPLSPALWFAFPFLFARSVLSGAHRRNFRRYNPIVRGVEADGFERGQAHAA